jgi:hypothetical protein
MADSWIVARCPLCGEIRHYLPSEIFRGKLSYKLNARRARPGGAVMRRNEAGDRPRASSLVSEHAGWEANEIDTRHRRCNHRRRSISPRSRH